MPPTKIPYYTDNDQQVLANVLRTLITEYEEQTLDLATGFFSPDVWSVVGEAFGTLKTLRLMLGKEPDLELDQSGLNIVQHYRR